MSGQDVKQEFKIEEDPTTEEEEQEGRRNHDAETSYDAILKPRLVQVLYLQSQSSGRMR